MCYRHFYFFIFMITLFSPSLITNDIHTGIYTPTLISGLCRYEIVYTNTSTSGRKTVCFMLWYVSVNILVNIYLNKWKFSEYTLQSLLMILLSYFISSKGESRCYQIFTNDMADRKFM